VDQCSKNTSKLKPVPHHNDTRQQPVEAIVHAVAEPFLYYLKSVENPPYIRFTVPGYKTILLVWTRRRMNIVVNILTYRIVLIGVIISA